MTANTNRASAECPFRNITIFDQDDTLLQLSVKQRFNALSEACRLVAGKKQASRLTLKTFTKLATAQSKTPSIGRVLQALFCEPQKRRECRYHYHAQLSDTLCCADTEPGAASLLSQLRNHNWTTILVSNRCKHEVAEEVARFSSEDQRWSYIDAISAPSCGSDGYAFELQKKPGLLLPLKAFDELNISLDNPPVKIVCVGDALTDLEMADNLRAYVRSFNKRSEVVSVLLNKWDYEPVDYERFAVTEVIQTLAEIARIPLLRPLFSSAAVTG